MEIIKCMAEDIEATMDLAEDNIKQAIMAKEKYPIAAKAFYTKSMTLMDSIKPQHDAVVTLIENYKKEKGEPPAPMMAIYNYLHSRHISQAASIKNLQDMYIK